MGEKNYIITFNTYQNKASKNTAQIRKNDLQFAAFNKAYSRLYYLLAQSPEKIRTLCTEIIAPTLFRFINKLTATTDKYIAYQEVSMIFTNLKELFDFFRPHIVKINPLLSEYFELLTLEEPYFNKIYDAYYSLLYHQKSSNSINAKYLYKVYKNIKPIHPAYKYFMAPYDYFCIIDKNLIFITEDENNPNFLLGLNMLYYLFQEKPTRSQINTLNSINKILDNSAYFTTAPCCDSNYSFNFIYENKTYYAYFAEQDIMIQPIKQNIINYSYFIDLNSCNKINLSETAIKLLYVITGGNYQNLMTFSMLCAIVSTNYYSNITYKLPSKNCSPLNLFTISGSEEQNINTLYFLNLLYDNQAFETPISIKELTKTPNILKLVGYNFSSCGFIPVLPSSQETDNQAAVINKIIKRQTIIKSDLSGLEFTLLNHLPIICTVSDQNALNHLQAFYKTKILRFQRIEYTSNCPEKINKNDLNNLACFLSIFGLKLIYDSNFCNKITTDNKHNIEHVMTDSKNIIKKFYDDCVIHCENSEIYADNLYNVYKAYNGLLSDDIPLTQICFTKNFRKISNCEYKKPRHSRSDNRYAFIGITVDMNKVQKFIEINRPEQQITDMRLFETQLLEPVQQVNNIIDSLLLKMSPKSSKRIIHVNLKDKK